MPQDTDDTSGAIDHGDVVRTIVIIDVDDMAHAAPSWTAVLGTEPAFVDGDRWAQFDVGPARICLAGPSEHRQCALGLEVADLERAARRVSAAGWVLGETHEGAHERYLTAHGDDGSFLLYESRPS